MKIASLVSELGITQSSYCMIKNFNQLSLTLDVTPYCFYQNIGNSMVDANFSIMNVYNINYMTSGMIIADSIESAGYLLSLNLNVEKLIYIWDLEWMRGNVNYMANMSVLRNPDIGILARSYSHADAIKKYCNKSTCGILEDWNVKKWMNLK